MATTTAAQRSRKAANEKISADAMEAALKVISTAAETATSLAATATATATKLQETASATAAKLGIHEGVCSERYANIRVDIAGLKSVILWAGGVAVAVVGAVIMGLVVVVWEMFKRGYPS